MWVLRCPQRLSFLGKLSLYQKWWILDLISGLFAPDKLSFLFPTWPQGLSDFGRALRCRWCCSPRWFGSGTASLSLRPPTMSRTKIFRTPRDTSKVSTRKSASSPTAARSSLELIMSSRSCYLQRFKEMHLDLVSLRSQTQIRFWWQVNSFIEHILRK